MLFHAGVDAQGDIEHEKPGEQAVNARGLPGVENEAVEHAVDYMKKVQASKG